MRILVVYGTATGQTRKIVEFLAERWRGQAHTVELCDAAHLPRELDPAGFDRIVVASCVRQGEYRRSVVRFVRRYRDVADDGALGLPLGVDGGGQRAQPRRCRSAG